MGQVTGVVPPSGGLMSNLMSKRIAHPSSLTFSFSLTAFLFFSQLCSGQFSASIQGIVQDPSGATVPKAKVVLLNTATQVSQETTSNDNGEYRFASLAPGAYKITASASGFAATEVNATLATSQNLNVPVSLTVAGSTQAVEVTGEVPVVNTAETRTQLTLGTQTLSALPLAGRNMISLVTLAPGVTGVGTSEIG